MGEVATKAVVTNPLGHQMSTTLDGLRGQPLRVIDANARETSTVYDPLGRVAKIWAPGRPQAGNEDSPSHAFEYLVRNDGPNVVTTKALNHNNVYQVSYAFYDGLLRARETQVPSPDDATDSSPRPSTTAGARHGATRVRTTRMARPSLPW
ncbi:hypothetical protein ACFQ2B_11710 [Streptomyces stramineus]